MSNTVNDRAGKAFFYVSAAASVATPLMGAAKPIPCGVTDAMDTVKLWMNIVAIGLAAVALILIGIGLLFARRNHDGGEMLKSMGWWIAGVVLIASAAAITAMFLPGSGTACTPTPAPATPTGDSGGTGSF